MRYGEGDGDWVAPSPAPGLGLGLGVGLAEPVPSGSGEGVAVGCSEGSVCGPPEGSGDSWLGSPVSDGCVCAGGCT